MEEPRNDEQGEVVPVIAEEKKESRKFQDVLRDWGFDLDRFESKLKESGGQARGEWGQAMEVMSEKAAEARKRVHRLRETSKPASQEVKGGFERAWMELENAFARAARRLKETPGEEDAAPEKIEGPQA